MSLLLTRRWTTKEWNAFADPTDKTPLVSCSTDCELLRFSWNGKTVASLQADDRPDAQSPQISLEGKIKGTPSVADCLNIGR